MFAYWKMMLCESGIGSRATGSFRSMAARCGAHRTARDRTPETFFDVDLSPRAGQYVFIEFVAEGSVRGASADWNNPRFVTGP